MSINLETMMAQGEARKAWIEWVDCIDEARRLRETVFHSLPIPAAARVAYWVQSLKEIK